ncbi:hypothetical protein [Haliangium sp.]|uniref:hypothetical protein n=1 Tax=Haliangium sp. TaxID=2663208 RepID=UPI003D0E307F
MTQVSVRRMSEERAAQAVNFRLIRPTGSDTSYDPEAIEVRLEAAPGEGDGFDARAAPANWSAPCHASARYQLTTERGRLRVKQYLYDWGPLSALDHAALYDHRPEDMRIWPMDRERVAWTGWDYSQHRALSMLAWGTSVEVRELSGDHPDERLVDLARSFEPVSESEPAPMAERSYWSRWPRYDANMIRVPGYRLPSSLWLWRWPWLAADHTWSTAMPSLELPGLRERGSDVFAPAWRFDSACGFGEARDPGEVQLLFRPASGLGHAQLWLRRFSRQAGSIREPAPGEWPLLDSLGGHRPVHPTRLAGSLGLRAFAASRTMDNGPHDIVWWRGRYGYLLQISAAVRHDLGYAIERLSSLVAERVSTCD